MEDHPHGCQVDPEIYQLGRGTYMRSAPIWGYNLENDNYNVPLGIGIGQVVKKGKIVYNFFVESQFSVAERGAAQSEWQLYFGMNIQILQ